MNPRRSEAKMAHGEPNVDELLVENLIYSNPILIFLASSCPISKKLQTYLDANRVEYYSLDLDEHGFYPKSEPRLSF